MNRVISQSEVKGFVLEILRSMQADAWVPDYIVGINRGGLVPANMISQYLDIRLVTLDVSFSTNNFESNLWIPEDILEGKKEGVVVGSVVNTRRGPTQIGAIRTAYTITDAKLDPTDIEWKDVCRPG